MNKYKIKIAFLNLPEYQTTVWAINCFQAKLIAVAQHRLKTGCSVTEPYSEEGSYIQMLIKTR